MNNICLWYVDKNLNLRNRFIPAVVNYDETHVKCGYLTKGEHDIKVLFDCPLADITGFWYSDGGRASEQVYLQVKNESTYQFNRKGGGSNKKFPSELLVLAGDDTAFTKWLEFKPSKSIIKLLEFLKQHNVPEIPRPF